MLTKKSRKIVTDQMRRSALYLVAVEGLAMEDVLGAMHSEIMTRIAVTYGPQVATDCAADMIRQIETMCRETEKAPQQRTDDWKIQ
jgi:hypothetical protein